MSRKKHARHYWNKVANYHNKVPPYLQHQNNATKRTNKPRTQKLNTPQAQTQQLNHCTTKKGTLFSHSYFILSIDKNLVHVHIYRFH